MLLLPWSVLPKVIFSALVRRELFAKELAESIHGTVKVAIIY